MIHSKLQRILMQLLINCLHNIHTCVCNYIISIDALKRSTQYDFITPQIRIDHINDVHVYVIHKLPSQWAISLIVSITGNYDSVLNSMTHLYYLPKFCENIREHLSTIDLLTRYTRSKKRNSFDTKFSNTNSTELLFKQYRDRNIILFIVLLLQFTFCEHFWY